MSKPKRMAAARMDDAALDQYYTEGADDVVYDEAKRARSEEARLTEKPRKKDAEIERLSQECASRFALAEKQEARAVKAERAVEQKDGTIKALADALQAVWSRGLASDDVYRQCQNALRLAGRIP